MKVCFGVILDHGVHNLARRLAFDLNREFNAGLIAARLPQHVALGPVFEVDNIDKAELLFDRIAEGAQPFEVNLSRLELKAYKINNLKENSLRIILEECDELSELNEVICRAVAKEFLRSDVMDNNRHHSIIAYCNQSDENLSNLQDKIESRKIYYSAKVKEIAMFISEEGNMADDYLVYKVLPLYGYRQYVCL